MEETLELLEKEIQAHSSEYAKVTELMQQQEQTQQKLEDAMERWMFLQDKFEQIQQAKESRK